VVSAAVPVLSVGNLSTGGTGKTPLVQWLVRELVERGLRPAIALRGYAARGGISDEAELYRASLPGVAVMVGADRAATIASGLISGLESFDCVVLDDGFQHRRLARACDVVAIDALGGTLGPPGPPSGAALLPFGDLREPLSSLRRAGAVVLTHADRCEPGALAAQVSRARALAPGALVLTAAHRWAGLTVVDRAGERAEAVQWLRGRACAALCGIGQPERFLSQLRALGANVTGELVLGDHGPIGPAAVTRARALAEQAGGVLVLTEKDWYRLVGVTGGGGPGGGGQGGGNIPRGWKGLTLVRPGLTLEVDGGEALAGLALERLRNNPPAGR